MIDCAAEIMTSPVLSIKPEDTLSEAIRIMAEKNISGLPVVDDRQHVVGIISEKDIINYSAKLQVVPLIGSSGWLSPYTDMSSIAPLKKGYEMLSTTKVHSVMTKNVFTVKDTASGDEAVKFMSRKDVNRVPVVTSTGVLVGIITRSNLVNYLANRK